MSRAPTQAAARHRTTLHQRLREMRASARRRHDTLGAQTGKRALVLQRKAAAGAGPELRARAQQLDSWTAALAAHDPERTVARGYAIVDDGAGGVITTAAQARATGSVRLFFGDGPASATVDPEPPPNSTIEETA